MIDNVFHNPPVSYEPIARRNKAFIWNYFKSVKLVILVGVLCLTLVLALLIVSVKIIFFKSKNEKPSHRQDFDMDHTTESTLSTRTSTIKNNDITVLNCTISFDNATWNKHGTIFVNPLGKCGSDRTALCNPHDLFIDDINHNLYVVDKYNNRIQKYSLIEPFSIDQGAIGTTVASEGLIAPSSIFVDTQTEDMYILDYNKDKITDPSQPLEYRVHFWSKNAEIGRIIIKEKGDYYFGLYSHIVLDQRMNIYVETRFHIRKWLSSTNYTRVMTVAGAKESGGKYPDQLDGPRGFCLDNDLTMYIVDWGNQRIQKWPANADQATTLDSDLLYPYAIIQDCSGNIYYGDYYRNVVYRWNIATNRRTCFIGDDTISSNEGVKPISSPLGMRFDRSGNMFVIDGMFSQIKKFAIL